MAGETKQILMIPPTPDSTLARELRQEIGGIMGPDRGKTKVIERGGVPITAGLIKDDPFPKETCQFGETCLVGPKCQLTSCCYMITCKLCDPGDVEPRERSRYIGQSGTTLHKRMKSHLQGIKGKGVLAKHLQENHRDTPPPDDPSSMFIMKPIKSSRTVVDRLVREGIYIQGMESRSQGVLMNSRSEWGRGKIIRFDPQVQRA